MRLIELIHRAVPYPVFLITSAQDGLAVSVAHKRYAENEADKMVIERVVAASALAGELPSHVVQAFLQGLALAHQPCRDAFPKPTALISKLIEQIASDGDLVLDFFAGSGTTGHALWNSSEHTDPLVASAPKVQAGRRQSRRSARTRLSPRQSYSIKRLEPLYDFRREISLPEGKLLGLRAGTKCTRTRRSA